MQEVCDDVICRYYNKTVLVMLLHALVSIDVTYFILDKTTESVR